MSRLFVAVFAVAFAPLVAQAVPTLVEEDETKPIVSQPVHSDVSKPLSELATQPAATQPVPPAANTPETKAIAEFINKLTGGKSVDQQPTPLTDPALTALLPDRKFYLLAFPQYPVARIGPEPLAPRNIFALDKQNAVTLITEAEALKKLFVAELSACKSDKQLKQAAAAWLRLSRELANDGMFQFTVSDDDTTIASSGVRQVVTGVAKVAAGGRGKLNGGSITATLTFDQGKLTDVQQEAELRPGIRPICQGTKLLDPDRIVRGMAERDLLTMGLSCKFYMSEQWQKADPKLRTEIERVWRQIVIEAKQDPQTNTLP